MKRAKKGFTLIEVICVLVIIAIIAVIAVPSISKYIDNSKRSNCESTMNNLINDIEYKIVSKRYYDVSELNDELVKLVDSASDNNNASDDVHNNDDGTFGMLTESITEATGICPNGGHYTITWTITPNASDSATFEVTECKCDCMHDDEPVRLDFKNNSYKFTAALITRAVYLKSDLTIEEIYKKDIEGIVKYINDTLNGTEGINNPARINEIVEQYKAENPECKYDIRGVTVKNNHPDSESRNWVEWICVSLKYSDDLGPDDKEAYDFITYYPEKSGDSSSNEGNEFQSETSGKLVINDLSKSEAADSKNWPPVEGTKDSWFYLQGYNTETNPQLKVADLNKSDFQWIQRDGQWYVQKKDGTKGIDFTDDEVKDGTYGNAVLSERKPVSVTVVPTSDKNNLRTAVQVKVYYNDGTFEIFDHLDSAADSTDSDNYYISNGFVFVDPAIVSSTEIPTWSGIFSNSDNSDLAEKEKNTLDAILNNEQILINEFLNKNNTEPLYVAYQEYYKYVDDDGVYHYEPITIFATLSPAAGNSNESVTPGTDSDDVDYTVTVINNGGDDDEDDDDDTPSTIDDIIITKPVEYIVKTEDGEEIPIIIQEEVDKVIEENDDGTIEIKDKDTGETIIKLEPDDNSYYDIIPSVAEVKDENDNNNNDDSEDDNKSIEDIINDFDFNKVTEYEMKDPDGYPVTDDNGDPVVITETEQVTPVIEKKDDGTIEIIDPGSDKDDDEDDEVIAVLETNKDESGKDKISYEITAPEDDGNKSIDEIVDEIVITKTVEYVLKDAEGNPKKDKDGKPITITATEKIDPTVVKKDDGTIELKDGDKVVGTLTPESKPEFSVTYAQSSASNGKFRTEDLEIIQKQGYKLRDDSGKIVGSYGTSTKLEPATSVDQKNGYYLSIDDTTFNNGVTPADKTKAAVDSLNKGGYTTYTNIYLTGYEQGDGRLYSSVASINTSQCNTSTLKWNYNKGTSDTSFDINKISASVEYPIVINTGYAWNFGPTSITTNGGVKVDFHHRKSAEDEGWYVTETYGYTDKATEDAVLKSLSEYTGSAEVKLYKSGDGQLNNIKMYDVTNTLGFSIKYKQTESANGTFTTNDLSVAKNETYILKDNKGAEVSSYSNNVALSPAGSANQKDGYFIGSDNSYSSSKTAGAVSIINQGGQSTETFVWLTGYSDDDSRHNYAIAQISSRNRSKLNVAYNKGDSDEAFDITKVSASVEYPIIVTPKNLDQYSTVSVVSDGKLSQTFQRKTTDDADGWYITDSENYLGSTNESKLITKINNFEKTATVRLYKSGDEALNNLAVINVKTELKSITEEHEIQKKKSNFWSRIIDGLVNLITSQISNHKKYELVIGVKAHYTITVSLVDGTVYPAMHFSRDLNHENNNDGRRFYLYGSQVSSVTKSQEDTYLNNGYKNLSDGDTLYVYYTDVTTKRTSFMFTVKVIPDFIYFHDSGDLISILNGNEKMHIVAYTGNDTNITIPAELEGYWTYGHVQNFGRGIVLGEDYEAFDYNGMTIYYVKKNNFETKYIGLDSTTGFFQKLVSFKLFSSKDNTRIKFLNSEVESNLESITLEEGITEICAGAFKGLTLDKITLPSTLTTIRKGAFEGVTLNGDGDSYEFVIPSSVTTIEADAFKNFTVNGTLRINGVSSGSSIGAGIFDGAKFNKLSFGPNVKTVEANAFKNNESAAILDLGSVKTIKSNAFSGWKNAVGDLYIPTSVTSMEAYAFDSYASANSDSNTYPSLTVYGGSNGTSLGSMIFTNGHFRNLTIGGNVTTVGGYAFNNDLLNNKYPYNDLTGDLTLESSVTTIGERAFCNVTGFDKIFIPESVTTIDKNAFDKTGTGNGRLTIYGCSQVKEGTHILGNGSDTLFNHAKFHDVIIGGNVEVIADRLMKTYEQDYNYRELTGTLTIESPVRTIGIESFYGDTGFDSVIIPDTVISIGNSAFDYSGSGNGSLQIYGYSKENENGEKILGPDDNQNTLFNHGHFRNVTIGGNVEVIGYRFMKTEPEMKIDGTNNLKYDYTGITGNLTIGGAVTRIREEAFNGTGFDGTITFAEDSKVETIEHSAFENLFYVNGGLTIPESVTSIGSQAFEQFSSQSSNPGPLIINGYSSVNDRLNTIDANIFNHAQFYNVTISGNVQKIADDFMNSYPNDRDYNGIKGSLTVGSGVKSIGTAAFLCCEGLDGAVTLNSGLETIKENAFNSCINVHGDLKIPETVTSIGQYAFRHFGQADGSRDNENKGSLTVLGYSSMKEGIKTIDAHIFDHAHFTNVTIGGTGDYVQYIADDFMENYTTETFDNGQTYVPRYNGVRGNLTIGDSVQKIGKEAFWDCGNFDGVLTIGNNVTYIGESAFSGCRGLYTSDEIASADRKLVVPSSVNYMGRFAFKAVGGYLGTEINDKFPALYIYGTSSNDGSLGTGDDHKAIFANSRFKNVTIGGNVVSIGENFMNNSNHTTNGTWYYNSNDDQWQGQYSYISGNLEILSSVKSIGKNAFNSFQYTQDFKENNADVYYTGKDDQGRPINCRYYNDKRGKLILHEGLQSIGDKAFANTKMFGNVTPVEDRVLTIPSSVTSIGDGAFENFCSTFNNKPTVIISSNYYYSIGTIFRNADVKEFKFN